MKMRWLGVAAVCSFGSFGMGCSNAPAGAAASASSPIHLSAVVDSNPWVSTLVIQTSRVPHQLPPAVMPPGPSYRPGEEPSNPRGPACMLCPTAMAAMNGAEGWELAGRPDAVEIANALGAPSLAAAIAERITDAEVALAETPASDRAEASRIVSSLGADLDALARAL